ncbi:MAG: bacteriohopanetetrol glucosamine biosynthesis glycosyltransferase HpnI [Acidobacteriota bacterium]|nr:bacteriohopanetetrol glucosamine biosynthesis glycosyltransferase HpnI [Acidobacteriota bacterium]
MPTFLLFTLHSILYTLPLAVEMLAALLTMSGIAYSVLALWAARDFERRAREARANEWRLEAAEGLREAERKFAPGVSILKPVKGKDERTYAAFASHCTQVYAGEFELLFGVSSVEDTAAAEIARLRIEYPDVAIRLIECPLRLGASGKVSNLVQMLSEARFERVVINDGDIVVSPRYLERVMAPLEDARVGLVTAPYIGRAEETVWSRLEALGISTDFMVGVLAARKIEGGIRFGLGSTLATTKSALAMSGGLAALVDCLADDYEIGARIAAAGLRVELVNEVVETSVPAYTLRGFCEHQLRWARSTRDSRRWGYAGLGVTYVLPWAVATVAASGGALWSFSLLSLALLARVSVALTVGVGVLRDGQVLRDILLLPLRDLLGLFFWAWSFAGDTVVWRGERFRLRRGRLQRM